jgi:hypothetical protein
VEASCDRTIDPQITHANRAASAVTKRAVISGS